MSDNFLIDDAGFHMKTTKNRDYHKRVKERFRIFINFLQDNRLVTHELLEAGEVPDDTTKIFSADLTPEGLEVVRKGYHKWLGSFDRGKPVTDLTPLLKALRQVRGEV
jgi:hypothetical protein